ncbi:hypothetical protein ACSQ67_005374 [Phaseolus vulgaris]
MWVESEGCYWDHISVSAPSLKLPSSKQRVKGSEKTSCFFTDSPKVQLLSNSVVIHAPPQFPPFHAAQGLEEMFIKKFLSSSVTCIQSAMFTCEMMCIMFHYWQIYTSKAINGQIYIPDVNWLLMSLTGTIGFRDIVKIGNATGMP